MKKSEIDPRLDEEGASGSSKTRRHKLCYSTPELRHYGCVKMLTNGTATVGNDGTLGGKKNPASDRILKENITLIGKHPLGIGLYLFDYESKYRDTCGYGRQFGVMADEVETVMPKAVSVHPDGYKLVNYEMLGIS